MGDIGGDEVYNELKAQYDEEGYPGTYVGITVKWDQHIGIAPRVDQYTAQEEGQWPHLFIAAEEADMARLVESLDVDGVILLSLGIGEITQEGEKSSFATYSPTISLYGHPLEKRTVADTSRAVVRATPLAMIKLKDNMGLYAPCEKSCDMKHMAIVEAEIGSSHLEPNASYIQKIRKEMPLPLRVFIESAVEHVASILAKGK